MENSFADVPEAADRLLAVALDVTDQQQAAAEVRAATARSGRIDLLVNNAGRGLIGAVEETSAAEAEAVFATNVFGLLNVTRAALPGMRAQRSGHVVNIGSMGGFAQVPAGGFTARPNSPSKVSARRCVGGDSSCALHACSW